MDTFNFDPQVVFALNNVDDIPTTEEDAVRGRMFIITPEQKKEIQRIASVLNGLPEPDLSNMPDKIKLEYSTLLNNTERVFTKSYREITKCGHLIVTFLS